MVEREWKDQADGGAIAIRDLLRSILAKVDVEALPNSLGVDFADALIDVHEGRTRLVVNELLAGLGFMIDMVHQSTGAPRDAILLQVCRELAEVVAATVAAIEAEKH